MLSLTQQERQLHNPGPSGTDTEFGDAQDQRFQMIAEKMGARLNSAPAGIERDMLNRFCERLLPVTFRDWMCKP